MTGPGQQRSLLDWPLAPLCLALAFLLSAFLDAAISPFAAFRALGIGLALVAAITVALWLVLRDGHTVTLAAAGAVILLVLPGMASQGSRLVVTLQDVMPFAGVLALVLGVILAATLLARVAWLWFRKPDGIRRVGRAANGFALALLLLVVADAVAQGSVNQVARDLGQGRGCVCPPSAVSAGTEGEHPDVFVLLLDGYARADSLDRLFAYDNEPFLRALQERGFDVAREAEADYLWTHSTLASMLNMRLVEDIPALQPVLAGQVAQYPTVREVINDNAVFRAFRDLGYDVLATASGYERTAIRRADAFLDGGQMNEFEYGLLRTTLVGEALRLVAPDFAAQQHRERILGEFRHLEELAEAERARPMLALVHVPSPHLPAVFDVAGKPRHVPMSSSFYADSAKERGEPTDEVAVAYREQLAYLNTQVIRSLDDLVRSRPDAVVIVMSDHGPAVHVNWDEPDRDALVDRTRILFAARTPGFDGVFGDDHRLVSTFSDLLAALEDS